MSYHDSLIAAGAKVFEFEEFGDYQGTWYALVEYKGQKGLVKGYYGSCSGCDAFESEFEEFGFYNKRDKNEYNERLKEFGESYLCDIITPEEALKECEKASSWDLESKDMVRFLKQLHNMEFNDKLMKEIEE
jgi:hypothetical protein